MHEEKIMTKVFVSEAQYEAIKKQGFDMSVFAIYPKVETETQERSSEIH